MTAGAVVAAPELSAEERAAIQRRVLRILTLGQMVGGAALAAAVTVGAFVVQSILGPETSWAGIATATVTMGTAFSAQILSRLMRRRGRRPGLQLGYALAVVGGVAAGAGAELRLLPLFLVGLLFFGTGQASNLLARYAATDLALPDQRGRAMSRILFASTFGAVLGPVLIGPAQHVGEEWLGLGRYTGPWLLAALWFALAGANTGLRLRPDPLVVAGGIHDRSDPAPPVASALRLVAAIPRARLALAAMVISQVAMVAVMTMTPVHLKLHGHEGVSQYVISLHVAGMYAFSPLVGRFADARGRPPAILVGGATLVAATLLAALSGDTAALLFPSLWLLGVGWSFGLIGGSSLLGESVPTGERVAVQGVADLTMSFCGGLAGFSSGFVREAFGYHVLANGATVAALVLVVAALGARRARTAAALLGPG